MDGLNNLNMSVLNTWDNVKKSQKATSIMKIFYDRLGIFEIRVHFSEWIAKRLDKDVQRIPFLEQDIFQFYNDLKEHIRISMDSNSNPAILYERISNIEAKRLYEHLNEGIIMELKLITTSKPNYLEQLMHQLMRSCNEFYQIPHLRFAGNLNQGLMYNEWNDPNNFLIEICRQYLDVKSLVLEELKNWQIQQIQFAIDEHQLNYLNQIQNLFDQLFDLTSMVLQLVFEHMRSYPNETIRNWSNEIQQHQKHLLQNSFIVVDQPKRVVIKKRKFKASVRWLIGSKLLLGKSVDVGCMVVSDAEARNLCAESLPKESNELQGKSSPMQYEAKNNSYSANFELTIVTSDRIGDKKEFNGVLTEKLALLFYIEMEINGFKSYIMALSLPIVLVVHGNQEFQAWATIVWDNAFLQIEREFETPQSVSWGKLSKAMNAMFFSFNKREYTKQHEQFLYQKLFQNGTMINPEAEVHWTKFFKEPLTDDFDFSFWEWFYYTAKLIEKCFDTLWQKNYIEGYISKNSAEQKLMYCKQGTFLLRFSESIKGAITISYVNAALEIEHVEPWDSKYLSYYSLGEHIQKVEFINTLYPHGIKKQDFLIKTNEKEKEKHTTGYVGLTISFKKTYTFGNWLKTSAKKIFKGNKRGQK